MTKEKIKSILLVEDEAIIALDEAATLKRNGFEVITAHSAKKAIELAKVKNIDLILMDIDLGEGRMDGTAAAEIILKEKELPIVFLTGHSEKEYVDRVKRITSYGYVLKNSGEFVLVESIQMAFQLFESNKKIQEREKNLKRERDKYYALAETSPIPIVIVDKTGQVTYANREAESTLEIDKEDKTARTYNDPQWAITDFEGNPFPDEELAFSIVRRTCQPVYDVQHMIKTQNGTEKYLSINGSPLFDEQGKFDGMIAVLNDITERKLARKELDEHQNLLNSTFDAVNDLLMVIDRDYHIVLSNYKDHEWVPEELRDKHPYCYKAMKNYDAPCDGCPPAQTFRDGKQRMYEDRNPIDNSYKEINVIPIFNDHGDVEYVIEDVKDITERKRTEEILELNKKNLELRNKIAESFITSDEGELFYNILQRLLEHFRSDFGYVGYINTEGDLVCPSMTYDIWEKCSVSEKSVIFPKAGWGGVWGESLKRKKNFIKNSGLVVPKGHISLKNCMVAVIMSRDKVLGQIALANKDGGYSEDNLNTITELCSYIAPLLQATLNEIKNKTQLVNARDKYKKALEEKDFLLRELNHRVKNNLAMVLSLIRLKESSMNDIDLSDLANQIYAINVIYEKLNPAEGISEIGIKDYIEHILGSIFSSYTTKSVTVETDIPDTVMNTKTAVSLGLIINEIATNALKHGYRSGLQFLFRIDLEEDKENNRYVLNISNNGKPIPEEVHMKNPTTLGMRLISKLVEQIRGSLELQKKPYPAYKIEFPIEM